MTTFMKRKSLKLGLFLLVLFYTVFMASRVFPASDTPEALLAWSDSLLNEASVKAIEARVTLDYHKAQNALSLVNEAAYFVTKVGRLAQNTANPELAWAAYNACNQVKTAISKVVRAAQQITSHSLNPDEVHAANFLLDLCESERKSNKVVMELALAPFLGMPENPEGYSKGR